MSLLRVDQLSPTDDSVVINVADIGNYFSQVSSFAALRLLTPLYEGVVVKLRGWNSNTTIGGGEFIGHRYARADDGGIIASNGTGYHWERVNYGEVTTPEMYGAIGDGSANDTAAVIASVNSGRSRLSRNYRILGVIDVPSGASITGNGGRVSLAYSGPAFRLIDKSNITISNITIAGSGKATGDQRGVLIGNSSGVHLDNLTILDMTGNGIHYQGGTVTAGYPMKSTITSPMISGCDVGIYSEPNTVAGQYTNEYVSLSNIHVVNCFTGISQGAGNWNINGGRVSDCIDALVFTNGFNSAHGTVTGVQLNHNSRYNLHAINCSAGLAINSCTFFADNVTTGLIYLENTRGFTFGNCLIDSAVYTDGASSWNKAVNCYNNGNFPMLFAGLNGNRFIVENWVGTAGPYALNNEGWDFVSVKRATAQNLTAGLDSVLIFDALNQKNIQLAYSTSTGQYVAPFTGFYEVKLSAKFVNVTSGYCSVRVDGGVYTHFPIVAQSGGMCSGTVDVYMTAGQVMTVTANTAGSSPQHDGTASISTLSIRKF